MGSSLRRITKATAKTVSELARRRCPEADAVPPGERSMLEDIAMRRPWNLRIKAERWVGRRRLRALRNGLTVVVVNWNTKDVTSDVIKVVQALSPAQTEILLIDNGSTDGSRELFAGWPGIRTLFLRSNAGHGVALDLGVCRSRTKITVTLDSDAVPLRRGWLDPLVAALQDHGALVAGLRSSRDFVHPVYLAIDTAHFVRSRLSFQVHRAPGRSADGSERWGENAWDTGELLTRSIPPELVCFVEPGPNRAPGLPGMTVGDVVYHHGGVSRGGTADESDESLRGWREACVANGVSLAGNSHLGSRG